MPDSYRDIIAYGDFVLPGFVEGLLLRVGKGSRVEGFALVAGHIPELPIGKIVGLGEQLARKIETINGKTGIEIVLRPSDLGALAIAQNLSDLANVVEARVNLGIGTAAMMSRNDFELAGAALGAIAALRDQVGTIGTSKIGIGRNSAVERFEVFGGNIKILRDTSNNGGCLIFQNLAASTTPSHYLWYSPTLGILRRLFATAAPTNLETDGAFANCNPPSAVQILAANTTIAVFSDFIPISASTVITLISVPEIQLAGIADGTLIKVLNVGTRNITFQDRSLLMNSGVSLGAATTKTLVPNQFFQFMFYKGLWYLGGA